MRFRSRRDRAVVAVAAASVSVAMMGVPRGSFAEDTPPGPAKAEYERRNAASATRATWMPALDERVQKWQRGGRFDEISAAVEEALTRFPDEQAVTLVVEVARRINPSNATLADGPDQDRLTAWCLDLALRALERLPRPPSPYEHWELLTLVHLGRTPTPAPTTADAPSVERRRILSAVLGFLRRWFDEADPLWDPTAPWDVHPPVRPSDPRSRRGAPGPEDEQEFRRMEEAWYATALANRAQRDLRSARKDFDLPSVLATLGRLYPAEPGAEAELRAAAAQVPELDVPALVDVARRASERSVRHGPGVTLRLEEPKGAYWFGNRHGSVGRSPSAVLAVWNGTDVPKAVPVGLARVAVVYGDGPTDERVLPPRRLPRAEDLVIVGPKQRAEFPLALPMPRSGLARVVVALENDAPRIGDTEDVWTGADHLIELVDVVPVDGGVSVHLRTLQNVAQRAGIPAPRSLEDVRRMVEPLASAWPDDRCVEILRVLATRSDDLEVVRAALDSMIVALDRGYGRSAHFAFSAITGDPSRPRDIRMRAVDGLARFAQGRLAGGFSAGPQVMVVADEALPPRLVADARTRMQTLANDADSAVAERARTALGR